MPPAALFRGLLSGIVVLAALGAPAVGQSTWEGPRTPWGTPEIDGVWDFRTLTPLERPPELAGKAVLTPEEAREYREQALARADFDQRDDATRVDVEGAYNDFWWDYGEELYEDLRTSLIVDPPDGRLPALTPEAEERMSRQAVDRQPPVRDLFSYSANPIDYRPAGPEYLGLSERCLVGFNAGPPMRPSAYNNNLRIVQTPDYVVLVTEMIHDARIVSMDARPPVEDPLRFWSGDSRGRWDGDTLVVDTARFTDKTATFQMSARGAAGSGETLHLVERFTPIAPGADGVARLRYEFTVDDPVTFTRPFTAVIEMKASEGRIFEYACHEGNYALPGVLRGARMLEREE